jgi:glycosyltransferase XagB
VLTIAAILALSVVLFLVAAVTLWWMLHARRSPEVLDGTGLTGPDDETKEPALSFSLIVPARREAAVLGATLRRLAHLDHPRYEVLVVVGNDDPETSAVARSAATRWPDRIRVVTDVSVVKNKPRALNAALDECAGRITGVFDAEDEVHPRLLRQVYAAFRSTGAHVVQGGVQLMNITSGWYALRNCLEYFFWFRSRLHLHAHHRFIPLGGNTVFVRTDVLRAVDGWDPDCLAEDCELGVRLSTFGARIGVAYDPHLVTREETPGSLLGLLRQRTRWNQGFLQVLRKGEWRALPTRSQRMLARLTLAMPVPAGTDRGLHPPVDLGHRRVQGAARRRLRVVPARRSDAGNAGIRGRRAPRVRPPLLRPTPGAGLRPAAARHDPVPGGAGVGGRPGGGAGDGGRPWMGEDGAPRRSPCGGTRGAGVSGGGRRRCRPATAGPGEALRPRRRRLPGGVPSGHGSRRSAATGTRARPGRA